MIYISIAQQLRFFSISILVGASLFIIFSIIKSIEKIVNKTLFYILLDIVFLSFSAVVSFFLLLVSDNGFIRYYIILGIIVGFTFSLLILGKIMNIIWNVLFGFIIKISRKFVALIAYMFYFAKKIFEKLLNILKKPLKHTYKMLYNTFVKKDGERMI